MTKAWNTGGFEETLSIKELTETVYTMTTALVDAANGTVQTRTMAGNETLTFSIAAGQTVSVTIIPGANTLTLTNVTKWVGGAAPGTIEAEHCFAFWSDDGATIIGNSLGSIA